ncbi:MAG TPA: Vps62-related protein [Anaeromyxobacter sp.]|nr:Vps62-related protein [Anaeromyxobacter sp.]
MPRSVRRPRPDRLQAGGALLAAVLAAAAASAPARDAGADLLLDLPTSLVPAEPPAPAERGRLLLTFAPLVLLAPGEDALPANVQWYLARSRLEQPVERGLKAAGLSPAKPARLRPFPQARGGSKDPADWTIYGHVFPASGGGILVQYWFFYAFNAFHGFGDHEADWEHVTVRVGRDGRPAGVWYSRHDQNAPGVWVPWDALAAEGLHPVVLSARGSHASYARRGEVAWFDDSCPTTSPARARDRGCGVWRTWELSTGGVVDLGSRSAPAAPWLLWPGRWGADGGIGDLEGGPPGPAFQPGWCSGGSPGCF